MSVTGISGLSDTWDCLLKPTLTEDIETNDRLVQLPEDCKKDMLSAWLQLNKTTSHRGESLHLRLC